MPPREKKSKGWRKDTPAAKPRPPAPQRRATKRPKQTSPKKGTGSKYRAVEPSSSNESDGDGDAPAPAPAAAASELKKCSGRCKKKLPQNAYSRDEWRKGSARKCKDCKGRKPVKSSEADVPIRAKIMTPEGAQDSVPVPDDTDKRSAAVQHIVRMRTKPDDPPDTLVDKAMAAWSAKRNPPNQWRVVNAATGNRLGACAVPASSSPISSTRRCPRRGGLLG